MIRTSMPIRAYLQEAGLVDRQERFSRALAGGTKPERGASFQKILAAVHAEGQGRRVRDYFNTPVLTLAKTAAVPVGTGYCEPVQGRLNFDAEKKTVTAVWSQVPGASEAASPAGQPGNCQPAAGSGGKSETLALIQAQIRKAAAKYNLSERLIEKVIDAESGFDPQAVSSAGARGLMQLMPGTARDLGVENSFDIAQNIDGGSRYLRQMIDMFGGNLKLGLAAYNSGPGTVRRYGGVPPYRETMAYVNRVLDGGAATALS
jgi:soluble lytic murein transglycosylase-like protein